MPLFKAKTDEEKAAEEAARAASERAEREAQEARATERERARFAASPAGQAQAARADGRRYLQLLADVATSDHLAAWEGNRMQAVQGDQAIMIESVEDQGWLLHDVGYVFQETATDSKSKAIGSGERTAVSGKIVGVYLFRAAPPSDQ